MSHQAVQWVLRDAPDLPPSCFAVLMGLAWHAGETGRDAYPSEPTLAGYARKTVRQVRRDLRDLEDGGLIRRGDQGAVGHLLPQYRPTVYDLAMDRTPMSGLEGTPVSGPDRTPRAARPDMGDQPDRTPMSANMSLERDRKDLSLRADPVASLAAHVGADEREIQLLIDKLENDPAVKAPLPYLRACHANGDLPAMLAEIRAQPATAGLVVVQPWCGECDEHTRQVERDDGRVARCSRCHPLRKAAS